MPRVANKQISEFDKAKIKALWEIAGRTQVEIAEMFGVTNTRISQILKEVGAKGRGELMNESVSNALSEEMKTYAQKLAEMVLKFKEQTGRFIDHLMKLSMKEIADAQSSAQPMSSKEKNLRALRYAIMNIKTGREEFWALHGLDKDDSLGDDLPDLNIGVFSEKDMEEVQAQKERELAGDMIDNEEMDRLLEEARELAGDVEIDGDVET